MSQAPDGDAHVACDVGDYTFIRRWCSSVKDLVTSSQGDSHDGRAMIGASAATLCPDQHARIHAEVAAYSH